MKLLVLIVFFRIVCMLVGMTFGLTGYLFFWRVWAEPEEDLPGKPDAWRDRLRTGAPGLGIMLLGVVITLVTLYQGIHYDLVAFSRALTGSDSASETAQMARAASTTQQYSPQRPPAPQLWETTPPLEPILDPITPPARWDASPLRQSYAAASPATYPWPVYMPAPALFEFIEPEYFRLKDPLWEQEEPAIRELRLLKEDLERAGSAGEPLTLRRFVLDQYESEIVYFRKALQVAEMYDLSESPPEYFGLETPEPRIEPADDDGEGEDDDRMVTAKVEE